MSDIPEPTQKEQYALFMDALVALCKEHNMELKSFPRAPFRFGFYPIKYDTVVQTLYAVTPEGAKIHGD